MARHEVELTSEGSTVRGWLYVPDGAGPFPAVALAGGWCYVREIVMPYYAESFCAAGIAALVFDYRNLGVSDGEPRQHLDPWAQIRDYRNALSFLERRSDVDAERLGVWGISYSGGHALILGATDPRVRCLVSQIPVVDGHANMLRVHGSIAWRKLWAAILEDRSVRYERPDDRAFVPHASPTPEKELSTWPFPETYHTFKAINEREAPLYQNRSTLESVDLLLEYDVMPFTRRINDTPVLMIVAEGDDITLWDLEIGAFNSIPSNRKRLVTLPHTSHMTLYSDQDKLQTAARHATDWFVEHLRP